MSDTRQVKASEIIAVLSELAQSASQAAWLVAANVGITVDAQRAFEEHAAQMSAPEQFWSGRRAVDWWCCESPVLDLWRHRIYPRLRPAAYRERRRQYEKGLSMTRQAILEAVLSNTAVESSDRR